MIELFWKKKLLFKFRRHFKLGTVSNILLGGKKWS